MPQVDTRQALENVLRNPAIWRADQTHARYPGISTTFPALDQALPDAGWPVGVLTELLVQETGAGELSLLLPALRGICAEERGIALLAPPWLPHARAWEAAGIPLDRLLVVDGSGIDLLWATEQVLRSGECGAVLAWGRAAGRALNHRALQRLQLAAGAGNALCFLYRSTDAEQAPSPAPLRIRLAAHAGALHLHISKCRRMLRSKPIRVELFPAHWQPSPAQVVSAIPALASDANKAAAPMTLMPTPLTAMVHEESSVKAAAVSIAMPGSKTNDKAVTKTPLHPDTIQSTGAALYAATADLLVATADLLASSIATSFEPLPAPPAAFGMTTNAPVFPGPAVAAAAPQWIAGGAAIASGPSHPAGTAPLTAVHSQTSTA